MTHLRRALPLLALAVLASALPVRAADLYTIDRRSGRIEFTVSHLGLFSSHGEFTRFDNLASGSSAAPF